MATEDTEFNDRLSLWLTCFGQSVRSLENILKLIYLFFTVLTHSIYPNEPKILLYWYTGWHWLTCAVQMKPYKE